MKTLLTLILLLATTVTYGQCFVGEDPTIEHMILTGDLAMAVDAHEVFVQNQPEDITILKFNQDHTKKGFFEIVDNYVDSHIDILYFVPWQRHSEVEHIYNSVISVNKNLFVLSYSTKYKRFIIRDLKRNVDRLAVN